MDRTRRLLPVLGRALTDAVPTALLILVVNFFLLRLAPGDAAEVMAGEAGAATEETLAAMRSRFGLDLPLIDQFLAYLNNLAHLSLGFSPRYDMPVAELIGQRLPGTLMLMGLALTLALLAGLALGIAFPRARPVQDLSFAIDPGETVALVGGSGSGKSLTALALMRLLPPRGRIESGTIRFDGRDIGSFSERRFREIRGREIAMVFQQPMTALNPVLTVGIQIAEVLRRHEGLSARAARARAVDLLDRVRIPDPHRRVDAYPHQLSGGMRQRVMIAVAVACAPKLLIADEPTTALDVTIQAQVLDLIDGLRRDLGMAVLLITHDLGVVGQWADRVVVMYLGRIVESAPTGALWAAPRHPYTRALIAAVPDPSRKRQAPPLGGDLPSPTDVPAGCRVHPRCPLATDLCRRDDPALRPVADGHAVACHHA